MAAAGILRADDRIELLDGILAERMTTSPPHVVATRLCDLLLLRSILAGWHVRNHDPINLATSVPEADLAVARGDMRDYSSRHPGPDDIGLVVEVADSTLETDRYKAGLYAADGIPHYWIVNLPESTVEHFSQPDRTEGRYASVRSCPVGESVSLILEGRLIQEIAVVDLLP